MDGWGAEILANLTVVSEQVRLGTERTGCVEFRFSVQSFCCGASLGDVLWGVLRVEKRW